MAKKLLTREEKIEAWNKRTQHKLSLDRLEKLEHAFSIGADILAACCYAGISKQTYYNWIDEDNKQKKYHLALKENFDSIRQKPMLKAYNTIYNNLEKVDTARWYAERKRKHEFSTRQEVTGADGKDIVPEESKKKVDGLLGKMFG